MTGTVILKSAHLPVAIVPDRYTEPTLALIMEAERAAKDSALAVVAQSDTVILSEMNEEYKTLNALVHLQLRKIDLDIAKKTDLIAEALGVLSMRHTDPAYEELRLVAIANLSKEVTAINLRRQLENAG